MASMKECREICAGAAMITPRCSCGRELQLNFTTNTYWKCCAACRTKLRRYKGSQSPSRRLFADRYTPETEAAVDVEAFADGHADLHRVPSQGKR